MKYVMFTNRKTGLRVPVFMSEIFGVHSDVTMGPDWVSTSAGFISLGPNHVAVFGHSASLQLKPEPDDLEICQLVLAGLESFLMVNNTPPRSGEAGEEHG